MDKIKKRKLKIPGKQFRKTTVICVRKFFGCYYLTNSEDDLPYAYHKTKDIKSVEVQNVSKTYPSVDEIFSKLETVLNRSVQLQSQDLQFRDHLKESLLQITSLLEKIGSQYNLHHCCSNLHDHSSKVFPNFSNFKFQIKLSKGNLITCVNNPNSKSLDIIEENYYDSVSRNSIVLHRCESQIFDCNDLSAKIDKNDQFLEKQTVSLNTSSEKSVQSSLGYKPNVTSLLKEGQLLREKSVQSSLGYAPNVTSLLKEGQLLKEKFVQSSLGYVPNVTSLLMEGQLLKDVKQFSEMSQFHLATFKINLVDHIKSVKKDVISLKNLLASIEQLQSAESMNPKNTEFGCIVNMDKYVEEQKFMEAECRAKNFVRFWKMHTSRKLKHL